ncbi:MAG: twin-arginine translocase subunit TatC [Solirubrobacteraceae bacterium]
MATAIRMIGHEDRLSLVDHLDELRTRLIVCGAALAIAFGLCLWQNHTLLKLINRPEQAQTRKQVESGHGLAGQATIAQKSVVKLAGDTERLVQLLSAPGSGLSSSKRKAVGELAPALHADVAKISGKSEGDKLTTLGIGEPFTTTVTVALGFAVILALPVILFEFYGFLLPALKPNERRMALPLLSAIPFLFMAGVAFGYFVALPAAIRFFVNFNSEQFNVLVQANQYYKFAATILLAMGLVFQVPVVILGATRLGIITPRQLRKNRRYALLACAAVAAFLPGDAITLILETVPLYVLYEVSILLAVLVERRMRKREQQTQDGPPSGAGPAEETQPNVQQIIDHIDPDLS